MYDIVGIYLVIIMVMISLSIFLAIIIVNLHHRRPKLSPPPALVKKIFLEKIPRIIGMKLPKVSYIGTWKLILKS